MKIHYFEPGTYRVTGKNGTYVPGVIVGCAGRWSTLRNNVQTPGFKTRAEAAAYLISCNS